MKGLIFICFSLLTFKSAAEVEFEKNLTNWIDSTFLAEGVDWNGVQNNLIALGKQNFKECHSIDDFISSLQDKAAKKAKNDKELDLSGFDQLRSFSIQAKDIYQRLFAFVGDLIYRKDNRCELTNEIELYLDMFRFIDINLVGAGGLALSMRMSSFNRYFQDGNLYKKMISLALVQHIFEAPGTIREDRLNKIRAGIHIENGKSVKVDGGTEGGIEERDPCFLGGEEGMRKFIVDNVSYPETCREMGEQGTVYVQFVVNTDGSLSDIAIIKSNSDLLSQEAIRVMMLMPEWTPGYQNGEPVRIRYTLPFVFRIG